MVGRRRAVACCAVVAAVAAVAAAGAAAGARVYVVGAYVGASAQGKKVTFALSADGATIRGFRAAVVATCARRSRTRSVSLAALKVATAGTFSTTAAGVTVRGRVDQTGSASGTVRAVWKAAGASCDSGSRSFSARALAPVAAPAPPPPPAPAPPAPPAPVTAAGKYCGFTNPEGKGICLDVADGGRAVATFHIEVASQCGGEEWGLVTVDVPTRLPIGDDRSFSYTFADAGLSGTTVQGLFDGAGGVSGTLHVHASFDQDGKHYDCESQDIKWTASHQG